MWAVVDAHTDITGVWIRWIDNKLCLEYTCECCGKKIYKVLNKYVYFSAIEKTVYYYMQKYFDDCKQNYRVCGLGGCELDIYLPRLYVGIEVDGKVYHRDAAKDYYKNRVCQEENIELIRIRDSRCVRLKTEENIKCIYTEFTKKRGLTEAIKECFDFIGYYNADVDVERDKDLIELFTASEIIEDLKKTDWEAYSQICVCKDCLIELGVSGTWGM